MDDVEVKLRKLLPSLEIFRLRKVNHYLILSFGSEHDFLALVRSASGVNIALEVGWLFEPGRSSSHAMGSCFLRLLLPQAACEERLQLLLDGLSLQMKG